MKIKVKKYARYFEVLCMVLMPIVVAMDILIWFFGDKLMDSTYGMNLKSFSFMQRFAIFGVDFAGSLFVLYGLYLCIKIARLFQQEECFTSATTKLFAKLSKIAAYWGIYRMIELISFHVLFMMHLPRQMTFLAIGMGGLFYLAIFVFVSILATLVAKASDLQGDQDLTV